MKPEFFACAFGATLLALPALADVPRVTTDLPVTQSLVAQVMGDLGTPALLLGQGADPHHAQLRPSQARALSGADLVVWVGEGLSPWLEGPVETLATGQVLELAAVAGLTVQGFQASSLLGEGEEDHDHDHDHHDEDGHDHSGQDPHLWLAPENAALWLSAIATELSTLDPEHAALYAANAETAVAGVLQTRDEVAAILAPVGDAGLVMFHDAYGYFASAFGLTVLGTISQGDATAPGAARLTTIRAALDGAGAVCLFPEANHPLDFAQVVVEGSSVRLGAALDPAGVTLEPGPALYGTLMRGLATAIAACIAQG